MMTSSDNMSAKKIKRKAVFVCISIFLLGVAIVCFNFFKNEKTEYPRVWQQLHMSGGYDVIIEHWGEPLEEMSDGYFHVVVYPGYSFYFWSGINGGFVKFPPARVRITDEDFFNQRIGLGIGSTEAAVKRFARKNKTAKDTSDFTVIVGIYWYGFQFEDGKVSRIEVYVGP